MKVYSARQPILNAKRQVVAYELKLRDSQTESFPSFVGSDVATAKLLVNSYLSTNFEAMTEGKPAFIKFPRQIMADHLLKMVPYKNIIVDAFESVEPNDEEYDLLRQFFHKRFVLALDDFTYSPEWDRFLPFIKLIKVNLKITPLKTLGPLLRKLQGHKIRLLAENVETYPEFDLAKRMGFNFFQGGFLFTAQVVESTEIEASQHFLLSIYAEVMKEDFNYKVLESYFEKDMGLTYKLMRFVNSSLFEVKHEITSLKQAMIFLGETQLRKFICLIVTAQLNPDKPKALVQETVIRARLSELMAREMGLRKETEGAFLTGLFSTIDAILDKPMAVVLDSLPLADNIKGALLSKEGDLAECLKTAMAYINGDWMVIYAFAKTYNVSAQTLISSCDSAYDWMTTFDSVNSSA